MLKRPLILKLIALFMFIYPLLQVAFLSIEKERSFQYTLNWTLTSLTVLDFFNFWFLFPLSGVLLLGVKIYSYVAFIAIQLYSFYFHLNYEPFSWPYLAKTPSASSYILLGINMIIVGYLLLPRSREIFFDKSLRWWERGSRYTINEPCFAKYDGKEVHGKVCDLSFGGALLELDEPIPKGKVINLDFDILGKEVSLQAEVIRFINTDGKPMFGTKFNFKNIFEKFKIKFLMFSISKIGNYDKYR